MIEPMRLNKARQPQENYSMTPIYDTAVAKGSRDKLRGYHKAKNAYPSVCVDLTVTTLRAQLLALVQTDKSNTQELIDAINVMSREELRATIRKL